MELVFSFHEKLFDTHNTNSKACVPWHHHNAMHCLTFMKPMNYDFFCGQFFWSVKRGREEVKDQWRTKWNRRSQFVTYIQDTSVSKNSLLKWFLSRNRYIAMKHLSATSNWTNICFSIIFGQHARFYYELQEQSMS